MKILFYSSPSFTDCDFPLVKAFQELGHEVTYLIDMAPYNTKAGLCNVQKQKEQNGIFHATDYDELKIYEKYMDMSHVYIVNRTVKAESSWTSFLLVLEVIKLIKREKFDVLHTDMIFSMHKILLLFIGKWFLTIHDPAPHTGEISFKRTLFTKMAIKLSHRIALLNHLQLNDFCKRYSLNPQRILVNRLGIYDNIRYFANPDMQQKTKNVLFFGRISPYKGIEYLCEAMMRVREHIPDATLTIAGNGNIYFDISPYEKQEWIDIQNKYISMQELATLLQQSTIVACPYTDATQSGVIMTAFSMCKPVVASNVGGLGETIKDGWNGVLVPPCDVNALSDALIDLLSDGNKIDEMAKHIEEDFFEGAYSWHSIAEKYIHFYQNVVS